MDSIVLYNRYVSGLMETATYFGTRFDGVRVELTKGANQRISGMEDASSCVVKIPLGNLPKPYQAPGVWNDLTTEEMEGSFTIDPAGKDFFVVVRKPVLNLDVDLPVGIVMKDEVRYPGGFFEYVKTRYGYAFVVDTVDVYDLVPRFEVGGK